MKIIKCWLICSSLLILSCFAAEEPITQATDSCSFTKKSFTFIEPKEAGIINSHWQYDQDPETQENVARLFIAYQNGDAAIIEHKYCDIYNFKAVYYSTVGERIDTLEKLDKLLVKLQVLNALASELSAIPNQKIIAQLKKSEFNYEKSSRINFDAADKKNQNDVAYSFSYDPLGSLGMLGTMVSLYVGYGGM